MSILGRLLVVAAIAGASFGGAGCAADAAEEDGEEADVESSAQAVKAPAALVGRFRRSHGSITLDFTVLPSGRITWAAYGGAEAAESFSGEAECGATMCSWRGKGAITWLDAKKSRVQLSFFDQASMIYSEHPLNGRFITYELTRSALTFGTGPKMVFARED